MKFPCRCNNIMRIILAFLTFVYTMFPTVTANNWETPGCHMLGHVRTVHVEGCLAFQVETNACRGYCLSFAHPSPESTLEKNPLHLVTSKAECCGIADTHDVVVEVRCMSQQYGGTEFRSFLFKSARSCSCSVCRNV